MFWSPVHCQIIKGVILDIVTKYPLENAIVYFSGTKTGTYSGSDGYFEIDISGNKFMPLTISALGYNTFSLSSFSSDKFLKIYLIPKVYELNEVVINGKTNFDSKHSRKIYLEIFRREFLGNTLNASRCNIKNEEDIILNYTKNVTYYHSYNSDSLLVTRISHYDTLKAVATKPIIIINKSLGYRVTYFLDQLVYGSYDNYYLLEGSSVFEEIPAKTKNQQKRFEKKRKSSYLGSRLHFARSLWDDKLDSEGYELKNQSNEILNYNRLIVSSGNIRQSDYLKCLKYKGIISIAYYSKSPDSYIQIKNDSVLINRNNTFDPLGIIWSGELAKLRIGDLLPYEYDIDLPVLRK